MEKTLIYIAFFCTKCNVVFTDFNVATHENTISGVGSVRMALRATLPAWDTAAQL